MDHPPPGRFRTIEDFRDHWCALDPAKELDCDLEIETDGPLGDPLVVEAPHGGERTIGNRFTVHPMEGWDGTVDGKPTELTRRRWQNFGRSGAKLIWGGEAVAVRHDGRANPNQMVINSENLLELESLREALITTHETEFGTTADLVIGLQLTIRAALQSQTSMIACNHERRSEMCCSILDAVLLTIPHCSVMTN